MEENLTHLCSQPSELSILVMVDKVFDVLLPSLLVKLQHRLHEIQVFNLLSCHHLHFGDPKGCLVTELLLSLVYFQWNWDLRLGLGHRTLTDVCRSIASQKGGPFPLKVFAGGIFVGVRHCLENG